MLPLIRQNFRTALVLALLLGITWVAYQPGLRGGFLFDDFPNLDALGRFGVVDNWSVFARYITSGTADPFGRPVALLTFLIDARDWPADPSPFLRTNLILHLLNGMLLFQLLRQLGCAAGALEARQVNSAALLAAGCWMLHPLFVSTTLYVVQRQAMLPATFTLLALIVYAAGRQRFLHTQGRRGLAFMATALVVGTLLATLSKANGILLPLLAGVLELTIFRGQGLDAHATRRLRIALLVLVVIPTLIVLQQIAQPLGHLNDVPPNREWTIGQRLLTEPRVLADYLQLLVVPRSISTGLFNDGYFVSRAWNDPWTTMPAILFVSVLLGGALVARRRWPLWSCAVLFFLVGHLLESTTIPLELYFEHRNYLPAMLLFWPLAAALFGWNQPERIKMLVACAAIATLAVTTYQRSSLWANPTRMAVVWASINPQSARAQANAAIEAMDAARPEIAMARLRRELARNPYDLQLAFNLANAHCRVGMLPEDARDAITRALAHTTRGALMMTQWLERAVEVADEGSCRGLDGVTIDAWLAAAFANPGLGPESRRIEDLEPVAALRALRQHRPANALDHFNKALRAVPTPDGAARHAVALASAGYYKEALAHLDTFDQFRPLPRRPGLRMSYLHGKVLEWQGYWPHELGVLRGKLQREIRAEQAGRPQ